MLWKICRRADSELAPTCFAGCYDLTEEEILQKNGIKENTAFLLHFRFWRASRKCWCVNSWPRLTRAGVCSRAYPSLTTVGQADCWTNMQSLSGLSKWLHFSTHWLPWFGILPITKDYTTAANSFIVLWKSLWLGLIPESSGIRDWASCRENELELIIFNIQNFIPEH